MTNHNIAGDQGRGASLAELPGRRSGIGGTGFAEPCDLSAEVVPAYRGREPQDFLAKKDDNWSNAQVILTAIDTMN